MATTTEIATEFETSAKELRKFLRTEESGIDSVGKGKRYSLPSSKREIVAMRKRFDAWNSANVKTNSDAE